MSTPGYIVTEEGGVTHYRLPPRVRTGRQRLMVLWQGMVVLGSGSLWLFLAIRSFSRALHTVLWTAAAMIPLIRNLRRLLTPGQAEIEVDTASVTLRCRPSPALPWDSIELAGIESLEIDSTGYEPGRFWRGEPALLAAYADGHSAVIAGGYPEAMLRALAAELLPFVRDASAQSLAASGAPPEVPVDVSILDVTGIPWYARDLALQPSSCSIRAVHAEQTHSYFLRRSGFLGNPCRFAVFTAFVLALLAVPATGAYLMHKTPLANRPVGWDLFLALCYAVICAFAGILLFGAHAFLRSTILLVTVDPAGQPMLTRATRGPLGSRERTWARGEVRHITTDEHSSANSFSLTTFPHRQRLLLIPVRGRAVTLMEGQATDMRWVATELRRHLDVPNRRK